MIRIPRTHDALTPILASIPLQLLAYHIAALRGANVGALVDAQDLPDQPWESPEAGTVAAVILQGICR